MNDNANYYRQRADKARKLAEVAVDPAIKSIHLRMAKDYEALATMDAVAVLMIAKEG